MMRPLVSALLACAAALLGGCAHAPGDPPNPIPRPTAVTDFATLYSRNCAACHGANGQNGPAIDLANPEYQALVDDTTLRKWISRGMPGTEMAAFAQSAGGMLTDTQVNALIAGMRSHWLQPNVYGNATPPAYAQPQAGDPQRGQQSYQARCAACHDSSRQQITSSNYLSLVGDQALRSIIIAGRPDIGQPDWQHDGPRGEAAAPLSTDEVDDIVAYLGSLRNAASGQVASSVQGGR
jgi:cytochrome c oxidase cbb3-type subunit III